MLRPRPPVRGDRRESRLRGMLSPARRKRPRSRSNHWDCAVSAKNCLCCAEAQRLNASHWHQRPFINAYGGNDMKINDLISSMAMFIEFIQRICHGYAMRIPGFAFLTFSSKRHHDSSTRLFWSCKGARTLSFSVQLHIPSVPVADECRSSNYADPEDVSLCRQDPASVLISQVLAM